MKLYWITLFVLLGLALTACSDADKAASPGASAAVPAAQRQGTITPTITLSRERIPEKGWVKVFGKGFTPGQDVRSHLRRPDGTEFPVLPMLTDAHGEFTHDIETLLLKTGIHDLWVIDSATGITSNVAHFEVTHDQGPTERPIP